MAAKKPATRKTTARKTTTRKTTASKPAARKAPAKKKAPAKRAAATKRTTARKTTTARKPAARKPAARKPAARKTTAASKPAATPARKTTAVSEKMTKTQMMTEIATVTGLTRAQVSGVIDELGMIIERHIKKRAVGEFTLPGLLKINTVKKPATRARKGINPFTGEETVFKAKPARTMVKVRPLKKLKEMAE